MITDPRIYFSDGCGRCARFQTNDCAARIWSEGVQALRRICLSAGLSETAKWGHPCYVHAGRNIAIIGARRDGFLLTFCKAALLDDPRGLLMRPGPNSQTPEVLRFDHPSQVAALEPEITGFLRQLIAHAEAGTKPVKARQEHDLPVELTAALDADPHLSEAFAALTPGRQKSYVIALNGAKKPETRLARIARFRDKIIAGKGALDR